MEPKPLYGALTVYRERGAYLRRLEQFEKAKESYDVAFLCAPEDVRLLTGRSQVCSDAVKPQQAYADAELAAKLEPKNCTALNMQARAYYTMSEFERSLVTNYRGALMRKQPPYFTEGIIQGLETLQDCVGENSGDVMLNFFPIIRSHKAFHAEENEPKVVKHVSRIPHLEQQTKLSQSEARKHKLLSRVLAMKYIGPMAYDKFFLEELNRDQRLNGANSKGSKELKAFVSETLRTLNERQEMLRSQRPYYTVKLAEKTTSKYQSEYQKEKLINERKINTRTAERLVRAIEKCMREHKIQELMRKAERMKVFLDSKTPRTLPEKDAFTDRLYRAVGEGYLCQHRLSLKLSERGQRRRIAFLMGVNLNRPSSYDSVIANCPQKFYDINEAIQKATSTLEMCENSVMKCWLMYELATLLNSQKNYALAKFYAKHCQHEAHEIGNVTWWLNGCFALVSGDMKQGNANEIRVVVEQALNYTREHVVPERERFDAFLMKCVEVADQAQQGDETKALKQREKEILKVMDEATRVEAQVLFKRIATIPKGRAFTVLPSKAQRSTTGSARVKRRQRGLTVIPGPVQPLNRPPVSKIRGLQVFEM